MMPLLRVACAALFVGLLLGGVCTEALSAAPKAALQEVTPSEAHEPLRVGVVGLEHGHAGGFFRRQQEGRAVEVVGVAEPDQTLADQYAEQFDLDEELLYDDLGAMLDAADPEAVVIFTNTFAHRQVVEEAARRGVHVMMEKPLAVNMAHARAMQEAAQANDVHVLVNYETTWYPSNRQVYQIVRTQNRLGALHKIVVRDGHEGPKEIGVGPAFLDWLTDPKLNGGGALMDFGCYGANLMTWLMEGRAPTSVRAVTQQFKSDSVYADVDDEATILVTYPEAQGIIQASWNWPYARKDLSIYGQRGYVHADAPAVLRVRIGEGRERTLTPDAVPVPYHGPLAYLTAVVRGEVAPEGLSSLENNMIVTQILDAARRSAETGRAVRLK